MYATKAHGGAVALAEALPSGAPAQADRSWAAVGPKGASLIFCLPACAGARSRAALGADGWHRRHPSLLSIRTGAWRRRNPGAAPRITCIQTLEGVFHVTRAAFPCRALKAKAPYLCQT